MASRDELVKLCDSWTALRADNERLTRELAAAQAENDKMHSDLSTANTRIGYAHGALRLADCDDKFLQTGIRKLHERGLNDLKHMRERAEKAEAELAAARATVQTAVERVGCLLMPDSGPCEQVTIAEGVRRLLDRDRENSDRIDRLWQERDALKVSLAAAQDELAKLRASPAREPAGGATEEAKVSLARLRVLIACAPDGDPYLIQRGLKRDALRLLDAAGITAGFAGPIVSAATETAQCQTCNGAGQIEGTAGVLVGGECQPAMMVCPDCKGRRGQATAEAPGAQVKETPQ